MENHDNYIFTNGINGDTGEYFFPPLTPEEVSKYALGEESQPAEFSDLKEKWNIRSNPGYRGDFKDVGDLSETGWGVIFAHGADRAIREALGELLEHRQKQAGSFYREFVGVDAYRPGESKNDFLSRHKVGPGLVDPRNGIPYYLLIVGDPQTIPYEFQYQLDIQYAVGRIHFDTLDEYERYARSVVMAETGEVVLPRRAGFFGVRNPDDKATQLSADYLVKPLSEWATREHPDWTVQTWLKQEATKDRLSQILGGEDTPALLFTGSHGMCFANGSPRQLPHQGAIICQDYPGPLRWNSAIPEGFYFSGDDLSSNSRLRGTIAFFFACFGAGTPELEDFAYRERRHRRSVLAPRSFVARLPQKMLAAGALAAIGHVERAWSCSYLWYRAGKQLQVFETMLRYLMMGKPVGAAVEWLNERYAEVSCLLSDELNEINYGKPVNPVELAEMWTANNDARSYAIIGDPAVRVAVGRYNIAPQSDRAAEELPRPAPPTPKRDRATEEIARPAPVATTAEELRRELLPRLERFCEAAKTDPNRKWSEARTDALRLLQTLRDLR